MERRHSTKTEPNKKSENSTIHTPPISPESLQSRLELVAYLKQQDERFRVKLIKAVLYGSNEEARSEMKDRMAKTLISRSILNDMRKESFYEICAECLDLLKQNFIKAAGRTSAEPDSDAAGLIARHAANLHWLVAIMIKRGIAGDFATTWASQSDLSDAYYKVAAPLRYEVSRVTATLLEGIGKGELYANKNSRHSLLKIWLSPLCDDYEWIIKSGGINRKMIEHGLGGTMFSLPPNMQQEFLLVWLHKLLNSSKECPKLDNWLKLWWSGTFSQ